MRKYSKDVVGWLARESERAITATECGLIAVPVTIAIVVSTMALGVNLNTLFTYTCGKAAPLS